MPSPLTIISGGVNRVGERRKEGVGSSVLSIANVFLLAPSGEQLQSVAMAVLSAARLDKLSYEPRTRTGARARDGHLTCIFNYNPAEKRPNGGDGSPRRGLGISPRGPPGPPCGLRIEGYQKCDRCPPSPFTTLPTTLTRLKCWPPTRLKSFLTTSSLKPSCW